MAVVIIGVTIRMTVLQRAREIAIMRLVGATNWFIRGPFLLEGALKGLLGGLLSLALCYAGYLLFRDQQRRRLRRADLLPAGAAAAASCCSASPRPRREPGERRDAT